jgi:AcrR family transcriptional regulator
MKTERPLRADAQRNRERILEAAEEIFAREGLAVPVDVVAERAGVGVGTVYRHFPTKEALFVAIVEARLHALVESTRVADGDDPGRAFFGFLSIMAEQVSLKHDLFDALLAAGIDVKSKNGALMEELESGIEQLRQRAVAAGAVRADVSTEQVMGLVIGACMASEHTGMGDQAGRHLVGIVFDGLRPQRP